MVNFPIKTATACKLKWAWSTLYLNSGVTRSCHRTSESVLSKDSFESFHNTPLKLQDRQRMLDGQWPDNSCGYCREIEEAGGTSDRMRQSTLPYRTPTELDTNARAITVTATLVEVYFNNTCNLGCLYCGPKLSSFIAAENQRHGPFEHGGVSLIRPDFHYRDLVPEFWKWFPDGFPKLARLNVLGGEPFLQRELDHLIEMIAQHPNPDCELNVVTNLMISTDRLQDYIVQFCRLVDAQCVRRIDITCSIDCWGAEQEYVRWGLDLRQWETNFKLLLSVPDFYLNINQTISPLTIKTMPALLSRLAQWRHMHQVGHWFSAVSPGPVYLKPHILGRGVFDHDIRDILDLMPTDTDENRMAHSYMQGIFNQIPQHSDADLVRQMFVYLNEKDRRRGTNWRAVFPWLQEFDSSVV